RRRHTRSTRDWSSDVCSSDLSGIISPEKWGNLPGGEVFTTPGEVNGTFVIDGVVGDWLCAKFGSLRDNPLTIKVKGNRLIEAHRSEERRVGKGCRYRMDTEKY